MKVNCCDDKARDNNTTGNFPVLGEDFSVALDLMKSGKAVAREGWNGQGMCVYIQAGIVYVKKDTEIPQFIRSINTKLFSLGSEGMSTRLPNFNMKLADGCILTGLIPTQTDLLSEDWCIVELTPTGDVNNG